MYSRSTNTKTEEDNLTNNHWINWCRLCAKEDSKNNINFLYQNDGEHLEYGNKKLNIQEALSKYFWVQSSSEDSLPKMLCADCFSLVSSLITFNERVERVQLMFLYLKDACAARSSCDLNSVRLRYDVSEQERDQWFSNYSCTKVHCVDSKSLLIEKPESVQTTNETDKQFEVQIKQENGVKSQPLDQEFFTDDDTDLEREEVLCDNNLNDSFQEGEEDPFNPKEEDKEIHFNTNCTISEEETPTKLLQTDDESFILKPERSKKKKRRKKLKLCTGMEKKKRMINNIKDFKMEIACKDCNDKFNKYVSYRDHLQQQHNHQINDKYWPCPSCDKILLSLYNLERHVRIHVPLEVRQTIKCLECDNRYTSKAQLETHIRYKHKNEKPFICEECGLSLRTNSNLRQHMLIHTDIAPYECEVCKKKFKNKTRLKTHMDIHSPNKHICNICGLQLNSRATLNRHFLVHSDDMQHKCDYCGKAFKRAKALKNHLLLHTGLKPYSCDFCERTFANGSNCRSHMKKIHPDELAILEASGNKTHTKNIPKLETLKAVTKAAENLTPVVTKLSGCFAFGKKPKNMENNEIKQTKSIQKSKKSLRHNQLPTDNLSIAASTSSTPLDLQYTPLDGNLNTTISNSSSCLPITKCADSELSAAAMATTTPIPNFNNIYQHLIKQNQTEIQVKRTLSQLVTTQPLSNSLTLNNTFYSHNQSNILDQTVKPDHLNSPESHHSSMTALAHDEHSNASSLQGSSYYGPIRPTLPPGSFM